MALRVGAPAIAGGVRGVHAPAGVPLPRPIPLAERIAQKKAELAELEQQQRADLIQRIVTTFPTEVFSALQIRQHPELRAACEDAGLHSPQQIGMWLRQWCSRIDRDGDGVIWGVSADHLHDDPRIVGDDDV